MKYLIIALLLTSCVVRKAKQSKIDEGVSETPITGIAKGFRIVNGEEDIVQNEVNLRATGETVEVFNSKKGVWVGFSNSVDLSSENVRFAVSEASSCNVVKINFHFSRCTPGAIAKHNGIEICKTDPDGDCPGGHYSCISGSHELKLSKVNCKPYRENLALPSNQNPITVEKPGILLKCDD